MNLHPDDLLFFNEVSTAMRAVAKKYELPLRSITAMPLPKSGLLDRMGDCSPSLGAIRLVLRCAENGVFCDAPMSPEEVWDTAAHELAHLRYADHGAKFQEFHMEMARALANITQDHREKVLAKLVKMQAARDGEAKLGNSEAAEAFAAAINRMLIENELSPSDIDYARTNDNDPVIEVPVNRRGYGIPELKSRVAWQESLARVVAKAHLCTFLIRPGSNTIIFVGTKSHATVAEYAYGCLVPAAEKMSLQARHNYRVDLRKKYGVAPGTSLKGYDEAFGFREAWLDSFIERIGQRFDEARAAAVKDAPEGTTTALLRLDGALVKTRKYIDDRFGVVSLRRLLSRIGVGLMLRVGREGRQLPTG